jgi:FtsH-binding integral membrane protein
MGLGAAVAFVNTIIILEALVLTALVFIGLTLYTLRESVCSSHCATICPS